MKIFRAAILVSMICVTLAAEVADEIQFSGVVTMGAEKIVSLQTKAGVRKWCAVGDRIGGFRVAEIRGQDRVVLLDGNGKESVVVLRQAVIGTANVSVPIKELTPLAKLNWEWIKSERNPMRTEPETIPEWAHLNWEGLDEDIKIDLKNYYRAHGWDIQPRTLASGGVHVRNVRLRDPSEPEPSLDERRKNARPAGSSPLVKKP